MSTFSGQSHLGDDGVVDDVNVASLFEVINERIEFLHGRDHTLGHSYFLGIDNLDELQSVFINKIIPLLSEYFYEDWEKVCLVLGCAPAGFGTTANSVPLIERRPLSARALFGTAGTQLEEARYRYGISQSFRAARGEALRPYFENIATAGGR